MSGSVLKVGELSNSSGLSKLSDFFIPASILNIGATLNAFNFKNGSLLDYFGSGTTVQGIIEQRDGYIVVGDNAYLQTQTNEQLDMTLITVSKAILPVASNGLLIGNVENTVAGVISGWGIAQERNYYVTAVGGTANVGNNPGAVGQWVIHAESRSSSGRYAAATRKGGVTNQAQGTNHSTVVSNSIKIGIGSNTSFNNRGVNNHSVIAFASVHAATKSQTELQTIVNNLAVELNSLNSSFNL